MTRIPPVLRRPVRTAVLLVALSLLSPTVALGEQPKIDAEATRIANEVSAEVYSPFCPGKTLAMCTSGQAADVRRDIQQMASDGVPKEEIKEKLVATYGEEFRYIDTNSFDDMWTIGLIVISLLIAISAVWVVSRRPRRGSDPTPTASGEPPSTVGEDDGQVPEADEEYLSSLRDKYRD